MDGLITKIIKYGQPDVADALLKEITESKADIVGFGELHGTPNPFRELGRQLIGNLALLGFKHLAIELSSAFQSTLEIFQQGEIGIEHPDFKNMRIDKDQENLLLVAQEKDFSFSAIDWRFGGKNRDEFMYETIQKVLDNDLSKKVVLWTGIAHLFIRKEEQCFQFKNVTELLNRKYPNKSAYSVIGIVKPYLNEYFQEISDLLSKIDKPIFVRTKDIPELSKLIAMERSCDQNGFTDKTKSSSKWEEFKVTCDCWNAFILFPNNFCT